MKSEHLYISLHDEDKEDIVQSTMTEIAFFLLFTFLFLMGSVLHSQKVTDSARYIDPSDKEVNNSQEIIEKQDELIKALNLIRDFQEETITQQRQALISCEETRLFEKNECMAVIEARKELIVSQDLRIEELISSLRNSEYSDDNAVVRNCLPSYENDNSIHAGIITLLKNGQIYVEKRRPYKKNNFEADGLFPVSLVYEDILQSSGINSLFGLELSVDAFSRLLIPIADGARTRSGSRCTFLFKLIIEDGKAVNSRYFLNFKDKIGKRILFSNPRVIEEITRDLEQRGAR